MFLFQQLQTQLQVSFLMIPKKDLKYLDVSVDEAIKTIVSAGIIELNTKQKNNS